MYECDVMRRHGNVVGDELDSSGISRRRRPRRDDRDATVKIIFVAADSGGVSISPKNSDAVK